MTIAEEWPDGLSRVLAEVSKETDETNLDFTDISRMDVCKNVQEALKRESIEVSLSQAEEIWSLYSMDKCAGWMMGGESVENARMAISELCESIEVGENHVGL